MMVDGNQVCNFHAGISPNIRRVLPKTSQIPMILNYSSNNFANNLTDKCWDIDPGCCNHYNLLYIMHLSKPQTIIKIHHSFNCIHSWNSSIFLSKGSCDDPIFADCFAAFRVLRIIKRFEPWVMKTFLHFAFNLNSVSEGNWEHVGLSGPIFFVAVVFCQNVAPDIFVAGCICRIGTANWWSCYTYITYVVPRVVSKCFWIFCHFFHH